MLKKNGFTLIEMLVSVAIFTVVMVVALGALLALSEADRRSEALNTAINNLGAALDSMSRTIRTGAQYHCGSGTLSTTQDCTTVPGSEFAFLAADGVTETAYCLSGPDSNACSGNTTCTGSGVGANVCGILRSTNGGSTWLPMTSPEVNITNLSFYVVGRSDALQPKLTMLLSGYVAISSGQQSTFNIETSVTQRIYDQ
jgi:prepilin-type N-terminal cleavage/methylation domain-containing protein